MHRSVEDGVKHERPTGRPLYYMYYMILTAYYKLMTLQHRTQIEYAADLADDTA